MFWHHYQRLKATHEIDGLVRQPLSQSYLLGRKKTTKLKIEWSQKIVRKSENYPKKINEDLRKKKASWSASMVSWSSSIKGKFILKNGWNSEVRQINCQAKWWKNWRWVKIRCHPTRHHQRLYGRPQWPPCHPQWRLCHSQRVQPQIEHRRHRQMRSSQVRNELTN